MAGWLKGAGPGGCRNMEPSRFWKLRQIKADMENYHNNRESTEKIMEHEMEAAGLKGLHGYRTA